MTHMPGTEGRANQKTRTRNAIVAACREVMRGDGPVTMLEVARAALVSEATAYRYFPDLSALLAVALSDEWPAPEEALRPVAGSTDPVERVAFAARFLLEGIGGRQKAVRAMMAATITRPEVAASARPGVRFGLIREALRPVRPPAGVDPARLAQLERDLAVTMSAEALFVLTDLCGLPLPEAIDSAVRSSETLTRAAFAVDAPGSEDLRPPR